MLHNKYNKCYTTSIESTDLLRWKTCANWISKSKGKTFKFLTMLMNFGESKSVFPCTHRHLKNWLLVIVQISQYPNNSLITQALWRTVYFITLIKILLSIKKPRENSSKVQFWTPISTNCPQSNKNWIVTQNKSTLLYDDVLLHISNNPL